ncbi:hypothetical protein B9G69_004020 [Bdellovibrio sp. SKB1291214]|uniref:hypothetical protein n=1 Tax=Bdellovibrio sp. SKB1291214 TaxID=1732569 RepID=UPI000B515D94|nr:hypothetical protein [Bdellovibrio sp. SKB1291214]UYL09740.1 hypothetical protein B9G69_004020 [Bdellovibrio sp. SKB1291214]
MIKTIVIPALLFLSSLAHAEKEVVVTCKGSVNPSMKPQETYTVNLTDFGDIVLQGQDAKASQIYIKVDAAEVIQRNDDHRLQLLSTKRQMGMVLSKQSLDIDYKTGKGLAQDTLTFNGGTKPRSIYLASCTR